MTNTRKNAPHKNLTIDHLSKVKEALEEWILAGEKFSVIQDEVEGGLAFDYEKDGVSYRLVLGYNELGEWVKYNEEI